MKRLLEEAVAGIRELSEEDQEPGARTLIAFSDMLGETERKGV